METYMYDGSWSGLLSCIFQIFQYKKEPIEIHNSVVFQPALFGDKVTTVADEDQCKRVRKRLGKLHHQLYRVWLSEKGGREMLIYNLVKLFLQDPQKLNGDYRNPAVLEFGKIQKEIGREVHRMHAFVRFQRTGDDIWFSSIEPDYDVIPLIGDHFEKRYADQKWVIYDNKRGYGLHYDLEKTRFIQMDFSRMVFPEKLPESTLNEEETGYQELWKKYFQSVNIKARRNIKLHLQHVPRRYWKSLPEKQF